MTDTFIIKALENHFHISIDINNVHSIGGGSINTCYKLEWHGESFFCKCNSIQNFPQMFKKEQKALELLKQNGVLVPDIVDYFETDKQQFLVLKYINDGCRTPEFWKIFGEQLARMHKCHQQNFGWNEWNYMGSVIQNNDPNSDWNTFFTYQRLQPLIKKCIDKEQLTKNDLLNFEKIAQRLPLFFDNNESPSLLHGDLWSGNFLCSEQNLPVLIDPAVYYGHRSVDLGMTTLFGGFDSVFYESYNFHYPLPGNHKEQWEICNLYPLLIHLYLFGGSYLYPIRKTLQQFC